MGKKYVIGVDLGGQSAKFGIVDADGRVLCQSSIKSNIQNTADEFINDLSSAIARLIDEKGFSTDEIRGIGVGAPNGNYYTGCIQNAVNIKWARGEVHFAESITAKLNLPCRLTNDANATAVGEMRYGAAKNMRDFIMITLGTGVGSGIVINGNLVYGHDGFAGELGHICVDPHNGRQCNCGRKGCLETYTSAIGVARTARELIQNTDRPTTLRTLRFDEITSKDVFDAAMAGDAVAKEIFDYTGRILGRAFADFVAFSAPEAIILFGGLTHAGDLIYKPIVESMEEHILSFWKNKVKVLFSALPENDAAILGAAALGWDA